MGRLEQRRKIARLEARAAATRTVLVGLAEARKERVLSEAVALLSDEHLGVVGEIVDAALTKLGAGSEAGTTTDLYQFAASNRDRLALRALAAAVRAVQSSPADQEQAKLTRGAGRHG